MISLIDSRTWGTIVDPTKPKRRFRFGLRTLLVVVTLAAMGSWAYWIGWPWWVKGRAQLDFEKSVRQIKVGMTRKEWSQLIRWNNRVNPTWLLNERQGIETGMQWSIWPNAIYCVLHRKTAKPHIRNADDIPCTSIEVFRLPRAPDGYVSKYGRPSTVFFSQDDSSDFVYDFFAFIAHDRKSNPGFEYELIYSDPPAKPVQ